MSDTDIEMPTIDWVATVNQQSRQITALRAEVERVKATLATDQACGEYYRTEIGKLRAENERLKEQCNAVKRVQGALVRAMKAKNERLRAALKPFHDAVSNDTGCMSVDWALVTAEDWCAARFAYRSTQEPEA